MENLEMPVTLIVKAPNQQIEDQTIECQLSWTVKKLKVHLSEVYPSKPRTEEQKLIYSGHLLHDSSTLKEVLRRYEGQDDGPRTHTLHLVCSASSPPQRSSPSYSNKATLPVRENIPRAENSPSAPIGNQVQDNSSNSPPREEASRDESLSEGLRHRFTSQGQTEIDGGFGVPGGVFINPWAAWTMQNTDRMEQVGIASGSQQQWQMQWMQQAYAQYLAQYMQIIQSGAAPQGFFVPTPFGAGMPSDGSAAFNNSDPAPPGTPAFPPPVNNNNNEPVVQDAGAGIAEEGAEGVGPDGLPQGQNRDLIDWIYFSSRFMVLLSIIYFYSTLARVLLVAGIGMAMYLWKVGFFRLQQPPVPNVQRGVREEDGDRDRGNAAAGGEEWNERPPENATEASASDNTATPTDGEGELRQEGHEARANRVFNAADERPTLWALTWTFFTSFFASLIPDPPNAI